MPDIIPAGTIEIIQKICLESSSTDAFEIAGSLMNDSSVRMHGPEHHYITAAAVLTAYCNQYDTEKKYKYLQMAKVRTARIPVGMCALCGTCGAMMGAGAAISIILAAHPFAADPLVAVNKATADIQQEIASYRGIRCCKRVTWASVRGAIECLNRETDAELPLSHYACPYSASNAACINASCTYYK